MTNFYELLYLLCLILFLFIFSKAHVTWVSFLSKVAFNRKKTFKSLHNGKFYANFFWKQ